MVRRAHAEKVESAPPTLVEGQDPDGQFAEVVEAMRGAKRGRVRVRLLLQLYRFGEGKRYLNWRGQLWRVDVEPTLLDAANFRTSVGAFVRAVTAVGPAKVIAALEEAVKRG